MGRDRRHPHWAAHADLSAARRHLRARPGQRLWDDDGKRYLDFLSGLAVTSLGHAHPAVADALSEQARTLVHVSNLYGTQPGPEVATTLDRLLGGGGQVFFTNSGAEANECAIKLARKWGGRGRHVVVSALGSFHGRTLATLHATGQPAKHEAFQPLPEGFRHVAWNDLDALEAALDPTVAAVLLEPVQGEGGVNPATADYFAGVRRLCDERGILFMVDEVQTGLGRTGRWFGHQHFDVVPDVVTMAKALGNGVPIGACWARAEVAGVFEPGDHATTFGGQPLAAAAARAVLAMMEAEDVPARATAAGKQLTDALLALPAGRRRPGPRPAHRRRAGRRHRRPGRRRRRARRGPGRQRRHPDAPCGWPRRCWSPSERDRRGASPSSRSVLEAARMTRHLLEIDDLTADELAEVLARCADPARSAACWTDGAPPCSSRSRRPAPGTPPRWRSSSSAATRSTSGPTRSASTSGRRPRTSPAPSPATTP